MKTIPGTFDWELFHLQIRNTEMPTIFCGAESLNYFTGYSMKLNITHVEKLR